ncbi:MAG: restriction endonuclease subunit S [Marinobacter sp.]|jgi:type I restriction enzyme S subunit|uniref:restriction endonuclease subunit S n=1 Tax=Marinobacter sp. TaxID=50741 RepID=UPI0032D973C5
MTKINQKLGWKTWRFDQIATNVNVRIDNPSESGMEYYVGLEHLDPDSLKIRRWGSPDDVAATKLVFQKGDIIFGRRRAYQRKLGVAEFDGICSAHAMVLRAKPEVVLPEFLPFFLQSDLFMNRAVEISVGSLSPTINWKTLAVQEFALPPMEEQRRIIESLSCLEKYIDSTDHLIASAENLRGSLMIDHFSKKYSEYRKVSEVGKWHSGGTPARGKSEYWGGDIPWISPKDMKLPVLNSAEEKLTAEGVDAGSRLMPKDTILIVVRGMILAHTFPVARTSVPAAFNQDMKALVVNDEYRAKYIQYWFEYSAPYYLRLISESSHGTKRLESENLFSLSVPKISHDEQDELIERVDDVVQAIREASDRRQDTLLIKRHFLNEKLVA